MGGFLSFPELDTKLTADEIKQRLEVAVEFADSFSFQYDSEPVTMLATAIDKSQLLNLKGIKEEDVLFLAEEYDKYKSSLSQGFKYFMWYLAWSFDESKLDNLGKFITTTADHHFSYVDLDSDAFKKGVSFAKKLFTGE
ncbi:MAG: hypothetical protein HY094_05285 [Candidatus Melainabacteria bacterium]|nr:hypothetical protein [Candidatus Melainabacteria bacterium]